MTRKLFYCLIAALFLQGCSGPKGEYSYPDFKSTCESKFQILTEELLIDRVHDIWTYKDNIVLLALDQTSGLCVHIFDKSGVLLKSLIHYGNGPKETLWGVTQPDLNHETGILSLCDFAHDKILLVDLNQVLEYGYEAVTEEDCDFSFKMRRCNLLSNGSQLIQWNVTPANSETALRMTLMDLADTLSVYNDFPLEMSQLCSDVYLNSYSCVSPDGSHFAVGTSYGAILETFDLKPQISCKATIRISEPMLEYKNNSYVLDNTVIGFIDMYATDKQFFAAFDGIRTITDPEVLRNIAIFDWNGKAQALIKTDRRIEKLCIDESENTVYACVLNDVGAIYLAKLPM